MTEQKTIEGCKRHDRTAQKHLWDAYADAMLMVCMRYVKSLPDAEELMLNGFYNFFNKIDRFDYSGPGSVGPWLKKIMVNECLAFLRKKGGLQLTPETGGMEVATDNDIIGRMSASEIYRYIIELPPGYRTVFNLYVVEGMSHKEIAGLLEISEGTSKSQLNKARAMLQKRIINVQTDL